MKNTFTILFTILFVAITWSQTPQKMSYQAVIRDGSSILVTNTQVGMKISLLKDAINGTVVYTETQTPTTNANGLITIEIGGGAGFDTINWASGIYFIRFETDPTGGTNYTITGTSQLLSVPYALHAKTAENITGGITETDPVFVASPSNGVTNTNITNWNSAFGWGNHATGGYLTSFSEMDPIFGVSPSSGITNSNISNWTTAYGWGNHAAAGYLTSFSEMDPIFGASPSSGITNSNISNWTTAYGWGNHAAAGYLTSFSETDPKIGANTSGYSPKWDGANLVTGAIFQNASGNVGIGTTTPGFYKLDVQSGIVRINSGGFLYPLVIGEGGAFGNVRLGATNEAQPDMIFGNNNSIELMRITNAGNVGIGTTIPTTKLDVNGVITATGGNSTNWNSAFSWGNHATAGYLTSFSEIDPVFVASPSSGITSTDITNWNNKLNSEVDGSVTNEIQTLSIDADNISLSLNGGTIKLPNTVSDVHITEDILYITYTNGQVVNAGYVGKGSPGTSLPSIETQSATDVSYTSATVNANITNTGNEFIISRGICLSLNTAPDLNSIVYTNGTGSGSFATNCNQLLPNTTYYVRSFATNTIGTTYGNELSFVTKALTVPTTSTQAISNITNTTAISGGNISDDGGTPILVRGLCWSQSLNPTTADNFITEGVGSGSYIALVTGLTSGTLYHIRAYATNAQGTSYGNDLSFTTIVLSLASISTTATSAISYTTATSGGNVTNDNGSSVTSRGICWATTTSPTTASSNYIQAGGLGTFTANMTGLTANTTYYVRAFAVNGGGTSYGNQVSFATLATALPSLTTKAVSGISSNLAGSGGVISTDGGSAITAKGICWSLNPTPTIANSKTTDGTGIASYNSTLTGLNPITLYYVRAYATNGLGTVYGNEVSFTTSDLANPGPTVPVVGTSPSIITGSSTASSGGYVSSDGGSTVTARGVCWSTIANPTLANNFSTDGGTGTGYFTTTVTGLSGCGNIYYVRAYATNSTGIAYGNQNTVSTGLISTLTTDDITSISYYTAVSGGNITDDGGCPITQKGVCWSLNTNPTIGNSKTTEGAGSGVFVSNISGLYANRTYYVRAYSTNSVGTAYGPEKVFTTATPLTPYIGQNYAGGIIFYLDGTGEHGLVCATSDQGRYQWGCQGTLISGTGTAVGTGAANTASIVAGCSTSNIAAKICDDLVLNGYNDWFLPSIGELTLMDVNIHKQNLGGFWIGGSPSLYHSSSETDATYAWQYNFQYGNSSSSYYQKNSYTWMVRAVRAF